MTRTLVTDRIGRIQKCIPRTRAATSGSNVLILGTLLAFVGGFGTILTTLKVFRV